MSRVALVLAASVAALAAVGAAGAQPGLYPNASVCARSWNRSATFVQKASVAKLHTRTARVFAATQTRVPQCAVYFTTTQGVLFSQAKLAASGTNHWTSPRRCPVVGAGILARVDARGFLAFF